MTLGGDKTDAKLGNLLGGMTMLALLWWMGQRSVGAGSASSESGKEELGEKESQSNQLFAMGESPRHAGAVTNQQSAKPLKKPPVVRTVLPFDAPISDVCHA